MADQKDQHSDPSAEESTRDINNDGFFFPTDMTMNLDKLQKKAYYEVLQAFAAESSAVSGADIMILKELKDTWSITDATHLAFEKQLETDTVVQELRKSSQKK